VAHLARKKAANGSSGREALDWLLTEKPVGVYVGVDPTAPSLHVGHLLPLMALYWMYLHGFPTVSLVGSATTNYSRKELIPRS
jgi:tyrosyl-tRNA synthetase